MLDGFHKSTSDWFASAFDAPTKIQNRAWPEIQNRAHTLIAAPTGLGKTLAAFLATIDELVKQRIKGSLSAKTHVEKNLQAPLEGISEELDGMHLAWRTWESGC